MFAYMLVICIMTITLCSGVMIGTGVGLIIGRLMVTND
jgi:hypothetical protein